MNKLLCDMALKAEFTESEVRKLEDNFQRFAELIVFSILEGIENEIELAYNQEEPYAAATLEAVAIEMLDKFDMEVPYDNEEGNFLN